MLRLIAFILISLLFLVFIIFNLGNACDISLGFVSFSQIPVFITAFSSFVLGMLFSVFFVASSRRRWRKEARTDTSLPVTAPKKKLWGKKNSAPKAASSAKDTAPKPADTIKKESGSYGID